MNQTARILNAETEPTEPCYRITLAIRGGDSVAALPALVRRTRGDLRGMVDGAAQQRHVYLGRRRIDDVVAALEAAGYDIDAILLINSRSVFARF